MGSSFNWYQFFLLNLFLLLLILNCFMFPITKNNNNKRLTIIVILYDILWMRSHPFDKGELVFTSWCFCHECWRRLSTFVSGRPSDYFTFLFVHRHLRFWTSWLKICHLLNSLLRVLIHWAFHRVILNPEKTTS